MYLHLSFSTPPTNSIIGIPTHEDMHALLTYLWWPEFVTMYVNRENQVYWNQISISLFLFAIYFIGDFVLKHL